MIFILWKIVILSQTKCNLEQRKEEIEEKMQNDKLKYGSNTSRDRTMPYNSLILQQFLYTDYRPSFVNSFEFFIIMVSRRQNTRYTSDESTNFMAVRNKVG